MFGRTEPEPTGRQKGLFGRSARPSRVPASAAHDHHNGKTHMFRRTEPEPTGRQKGLFGRSARPSHAPASVAHDHHNGQTQKRHVGVGEKISGAFLKMKGTVTGHTGEKDAGTRRMHGTDMRGSRRSRLFRRGV